MEINIKHTRVFASLDHYADEVLSSPFEANPLKIEVDSGVSIEVYFGDCPKWVKEAYHNTFSPFVGGKRTELDLGKYRSFICVSATMKRMINRESINSINAFWLEQGLAESIYRETRKRASALLNNAILSIGSITGYKKFFANKFLSSCYFEFEELPIYAHSKITGHNAHVHTGPLNLPNLTQLNVTNRLGACIDQKKQFLKSLDQSRHWFVSALGEDDEWKKFQFAFLALEVLANKVIKSKYKEFIYDLDISLGSSKMEEAEQAVVHEILCPENKLTLKTKFKLLTLIYRRENITSDIDFLEKCKSIRDSISHGTIDLSDKLPSSELVSYLEELFTSIIDSEAPL